MGFLRQTCNIYVFYILFDRTHSKFGIKIFEIA